MTRGRRSSPSAAYLAKSAHSRAADNRVLDVVDAYDRDPTQWLSGLAKRYGTTTATIKDRVPTRKLGRRLQLAPPSERRLYRGSITMLADVDGRPQVVRVTPSNDAQRRAIEGHDAAVFGAITRDDDSRLGKYRSRVVVDAETGRRYKPYVDGDGIREATDTGEVELEDLYYSGGRRHDLDALIAERGAE